MHVGPRAHIKHEISVPSVAGGRCRPWAVTATKPTIRTDGFFACWQPVHFAEWRSVPSIQLLRTVKVISAPTRSTKPRTSGGMKGQSAGAALNIVLRSVYIDGGCPMPTACQCRTCLPVGSSADRCLPYAMPGLCVRANNILNIAQGAEGENARAAGVCGLVHGAQRQRQEHGGVHGGARAGAPWLADGPARRRQRPPRP